MTFQKVLFALYEFVVCHVEIPFRVPTYYKIKKDYYQSDLVLYELIIGRNAVICLVTGKDIKKVLKSFTATIYVRFL